MALNQQAREVLLSLDSSALKDLYVYAVLYPARTMYNNSKDNFTLISKVNQWANVIDDLNELLPKMISEVDRYVLLLLNIDKQPLKKIVHKMLKPSGNLRKSMGFESPNALKMSETQHIKPNIKAEHCFSNIPEHIREQVIHELVPYLALEKL